MTSIALAVLEVRIRAPGSPGQIPHGEPPCPFLCLSLSRTHTRTHPLLLLLSWVAWKCAALVSPADLARAADLLPSVSSTGSGRFATRRLPSGVVLVLNADTFTDDAVVDRVLNLFPDNESPDAATGVTPADVAVAERVGIILAQEFLMVRLADPSRRHGRDILWNAC